MLKIRPRETPLKLKSLPVSATVISTEHPVRIEEEKQRKKRNVEGKGGGFARQPRTSLKGLSSGDVSPRPQNGHRRVCTSVARPYVCSAFLNKKGANEPREEHRR